MMTLNEKRQASDVNSRVHLEMDELEELLGLARKTDARSWCILTLAFNHGLRVSECAGGAPTIPGKNRPAIPPLTFRDIDMKHRTIRVRRLKGSLETVQAFVEHRGKPALSDYACLRAYLAVRIDDGSNLLFTGQKGPLHRWALNRMYVELLNQVPSTMDQAIRLLGTNQKGSPSRSKKKRVHLKAWVVFTVPSISELSRFTTLSAFFPKATMASSRSISLGRMW